MDAYLGLDVGTTSAKAGIFSTHGNLLGLGRRGYALDQPLPGRAEQSPFAIEEALELAIIDALLEAKLAPGALRGIGVGTAMHGLMAVAANGTPLTPLITWADNRAAEEAAELRKQTGGLELYRRTGTPIHPMTPLAKLIWLRTRAPETFQAAARFVSFKEWLLHRWFGCWVIDHSLASGSGLFALDTLEWDPEAMAIAGVGPEQLSMLVPTTHVLTGIAPVTASRLGLRVDVPVVVGAGDGPLANLGVAAIGTGEVAVTIGTSGAVRAVTATPRTDEQMRTFCYALAPGVWVQGGATSNGGLVLRWLRDGFCAPEVAEAARRKLDPYDVMAEQAATVRAGSEGLVMLPLLAGERAPAWNAHARGMLFGLSLNHGRPHLIRAAMEGVLLGVHAVLLAMRELDPATGAHPIRASGGFARSDFWCQMLADVAGQPVETPATTEASALGAAALAAHALGDLPGLADVRSWAPITRRFEPVSSTHQIYREVVALYSRLYERVAPEFEALIALRSDDA